MGRLKIYEVEIKTIVLVAATDEDYAYTLTQDDMREIKSDTDFEIDVLGVGKITSMPPGWDLDCIPYGYDGTKSINELNAEQACDNEESKS